MRRVAFLEYPFSPSLHQEPSRCYTVWDVETETAWTQYASYAQAHHHAVGAYIPNRMMVSLS